jgi:hypothetical protein
MPTSQATVRTDRASRYLVQFCKHATAMGGTGRHRRIQLPGMPVHPEVEARADCSDTHGVITFTPGGRCTIEADATTLTVRIEATDEQALQRIQDIISRDLGRFSQRDPLTLTWHGSEPPSRSA